MSRVQLALNVADLDAAVALALLSFIATVAAARYLGSGGPFG